MNIACPECSTIYRVDPDRVPEGGTAARCRECGTVVRVDPSAGPAGAGEFVTAERVELGAPDTTEDAVEPETGEDAPPEPEPSESTGGTEAPEDATGADAPAPGGGAAPAFGPQDPETRARRLARALVSDIKVYHPEKWEESAEQGTLRSDFREEILKSWEEYVEQVGEEMAKKTPYFRDALNEILAQGDRVF